MVISLPWHECIHPKFADCHQRGLEQQICAAFNVCQAAHSVLFACTGLFTGFQILQQILHLESLEEHLAERLYRIVKGDDAGVRYERLLITMVAVLKVNSRHCWPPILLQRFSPIIMRLVHLNGVADMIARFAWLEDILTRPVPQQCILITPIFILLSVLQHCDVGLDACRALLRELQALCMSSLCMQKALMLRTKSSGRISIPSSLGRQVAIRGGAYRKLWLEVTLAHFMLTLT